MVGEDEGCDFGVDFEVDVGGVVIWCYCEFEWVGYFWYFGGVEEKGVEGL